MLKLIKRYLHLLVLILAAAGLTVHFLWNLEYNTGYRPDQPIPFSHKLHAGTYKMDCLYCHAGAEKGPRAGIPPMNVCMGCHSVIALDKPNIQNLTKIYNSGKAVQWVRVHRLPDHVYFTHKRHVNAGIRCQECHGPVETRPVIGQEKRLEMGDCLDCHRKTNFSDAYVASLDSIPGGQYAAGIYKTYDYMKYLNRQSLASAEMAGQLPQPPAPPEQSATGVFPRNNALTQCSTCHQ